MDSEYYEKYQTNFNKLICTNGLVDRDRKTYANRPILNPNKTLSNQIEENPSLIAETNEIPMNNSNTFQ